MAIGASKIGKKRTIRLGKRGPLSKIKISYRELGDDTVVLQFGWLGSPAVKRPRSKMRSPK